MRAYRVFPHDPNARQDEPGGVLFAPVSGSNRIANPALFREIYLSDSPVGAIAEAFGRFDTWSHARFTRNGYDYVLAAYDIANGAAICNLDDARRLLSLQLKPSGVVSPDRQATQAWAARIYETNQWIGISWWSRYDSRWQSLGIWNRAALASVGAPDVLSPNHPAVLEAAKTLPRRILE